MCGLGRHQRNRSERGQMRISEKSKRVVRTGVWLVAAAWALVVGWQAARGLQAAEESHGVVAGEMGPGGEGGGEFFLLLHRPGRSWEGSSGVPPARTRVC